MDFYMNGKKKKSIFLAQDIFIDKGSLEILEKMTMLNSFRTRK